MLQFQHKVFVAVTHHTRYLQLFSLFITPIWMAEEGSSPAFISSIATNTLPGKKVTSTTGVNVAVSAQGFCCSYTTHTLSATFFPVHYPYLDGRRGQ